MRRAILTAGFLMTPSVFSGPPPFKERIRGVYENKIRQNAPPEKRFEIFASIKEGKQMFMTPGDFFKSISPYNYAPLQKTDFFSTHESLLIKIADTNGDGKISFEEYMFFIILLTTPNEALKSKFDDSDKGLNLGEFVEMMKHSKAINIFSKQTTSAREGLDPRSTRFSDQAFQESCAKLFQVIFAGKERVMWNDYLDLKDLITEELLFYEFHQFEIGEDSCISAEDFAKSIISHVRTAKVDAFLLKLEEIPLNVRISFPEYIAFAGTVQDNKKLEMTLTKKDFEDGVHALSKTEFRKIMKELSQESRLCRKYNIYITDQQCDIFFELLDLDDSGYLEPSEFYDILVSRSAFGTDQSAKPRAQDVSMSLKKAASGLLGYLGLGKWLEGGSPSGN